MQDIKLYHTNACDSCLMDRNICI